MSFKPTVLFDSRGKLINNKPRKKMAFSQYGSVYEFPNYGRYTWQQYVNQDTELGASGLTRDLLCRWSRTVSSQLPWIKGAINTLENFTVANEYKPLFEHGKNQLWWDTEALPFLNSYYLNNCCARGKKYTFNGVISVLLKRMLIDGDVGILFGKDGTFQLIMSHRIGSPTNFRISSNDNQSQAGPIPNTTESDGVIYNRDGAPIGYSVSNPDNFVNSLLGHQNRQLFSARDMTLVYDPTTYFDRGRGFPAVSDGILQCLSLQQIERYVFEGIQVQQMTALVEKTPSGEGPEDEAQMFRSLMSDEGGIAGMENLDKAEHSTGMKIIDGPTHKYVLVNGGDVKFMATDAMATATQDILITKQKEILFAMGVPHSIVLSGDKMSGRMSDGECKKFNATITHYQNILDPIARLIISQALTKAMLNKDIAPNWDEDIYNALTFSHPRIYTLNDSYDRQDDLDYFRAGLRSMNDITMKSSGKTAEHTMTEIANEVKLRYNIANKTADDINQMVGREVTSVEKIVDQMQEKEDKATPPVQPTEDVKENKDNDNEPK